MSDEILNQILEKAAKDRKFCKLLFQKRADALAEFDLNEAEKNMLLSASDMQLNQMINQKRSWLAKEVVPSYGKSGCAAGTAAAALVGVLLLSSTATLGSTGRVPDEVHAKVILQNIAFAEANYKKEFHCYTDLATLEKQQFIHDCTNHPYQIKIILKDDGFMAIATHKKRPDTRAKFEIGPDQKIRRIDPQPDKKQP